MSKTETPKRTGRRCAPLDNPPNRLRELRLARGYTLDELGHIVGIPGTSIHRAETRGVGISTKIWLKLADLFGLHPRELLRPPKTGQNS